MGFFNWIMHGLGFEDDKKSKDKTVVAEKEDEKYADLDIADATKTDQVEVNASGNVAGNFGGFNFSNGDIVMFEPKTQADIKKVVDCLKNGKSVAVNLGLISDEDRDKVFNFLSGAIYGINGSIHRWQGDLFILAPEGNKIYKSNN